MDVIYDHLGIPRKVEHLRMVERLETLKKESGANFWPVIEECFHMWESTNPTEWESYLVYMDDVRSTRKNKTYAWNSKKGDPVHGGIIRYTLDIPRKVHDMIRCLYTPDELPMNSPKFTQEFARRFPQYKVAEKL